MEIALVLPKEHGICGVWLADKNEDGKFDLHVLVNEGSAVVIGKNTPELYDNTMKPAFTDPALVIEKDKCWLQFKGKNGEPQRKDLDTRTVRVALENMLNKLKGSRKPRKKT